MMRTRGGRARSQEADSSALVLRLHRAVRQLRIGRHSFRESACSARDVEYQPVQNVIRLFLNGDVRVVEDQSETDRVGGHMCPLKLGRNWIRIRLSILTGD